MLEKQEQQLRSLAEELEALRAQASSLPARSASVRSSASCPLAPPAAAAAAVALGSPDRKQAAGEAQQGRTPVGSGAGTPSAMASFQQRLSPLALQPACAQKQQQQQQGTPSWSPKATVDSLADLRCSSSAAMGSGPRRAELRATHSAGCSPAKSSGSPAALGRLLRQTLSARELSDQQLRRSMQAHSETQAALAAARAALAAEAAVASAPSSAGASPTQQVSRADRPSSAPLVAASKRPGLPRPPTLTADFRIAAFRPGSGSVGGTPRSTPNRWQQVPSPTGSEALSSSRIPKPLYSPASSTASTPTTSHIPRLVSASAEAW